MNQRIKLRLGIVGYILLVTVAWIAAAIVLVLVAFVLGNL